MKTVFADASYWIALLHPRDSLHAVATKVSEQLGDHHVVTTEIVLAEVFNGLAKYGVDVRQLVTKTTNELRNSSQVTIIHQTSTQFRDGSRRYEIFSDKDWGLTDCVSFDVMEDRSIIDALTSDHHFVQAGFSALLRQ